MENSKKAMERHLKTFYVMYLLSVFLPLLCVCMGVCLHVSKSVPTVFAHLVPENIRSPGTGVTDGCELPCGVLGVKLNGLLQEQPVLNP